MSIEKQFGGVIIESDVLKKIISIGFEFETHDIAKLSLEGDSYLINSGNNNEDLDEEKQKNDNYFQYEAALDLSDDSDISSLKTSIESDPTLFTPPTVKSGEIDAEYQEYMLEPKPTDGDKIKSAITNDIASSKFAMMLNRKCRGREEHKNALYIFRTENGQLYRMKFDDEIRKTSCGTFSGLEVVITYYAPEKSKNVIVKTFADACERIVNHLSGMSEIKGELYLANKNKSGYTAVGKMDYRKLYHKEGTNVFYLETYDSLYNPKRMPLKNINFKPQMTFCTNVEDIYDVIAQLCDPSKSRGAMKEKKELADMAETYATLMHKIRNMVQAYNDINTQKGWKCEIDMSTSFGKIMLNYLFLIYIKLDAYLEFEKQTESELAKLNAKKKYLKNYLYMYVRHTNGELYERMKFHMKKQFKRKTNKEIVELLSVLMYNVNYLSTAMYPNRAEIFNTKLNRSDPNFGDAQISLKSYFDYLEKPIDKDLDDWLLASGLDGSSTMYPLAGDNIIVETRFFSDLARHYLVNELKLRLQKNNSITLKNMMDIVAHVKDKNAKELEANLSNKVLNPNTGRLVNKCAEGKVRNENFRCVKPRTNVRAAPGKPRTERVPKANEKRTRRKKP